MKKKSPREHPDLYSDWPSGRPFDKHRHLCELCATGVVMWTSADATAARSTTTHHQGACARCRTKLGPKEAQRSPRGAACVGRGARARPMSEDHPDPSWATKGKRTGTVTYFLGWRRRAGQVREVRGRHLAARAARLPRVPALRAAAERAGRGEGAGVPLSSSRRRSRRSRSDRRVARLHPCDPLPALRDQRGCLLAQVLGVLRDGRAALARDRTSLADVGVVHARRRAPPRSRAAGRQSRPMPTEGLPDDVLRDKIRAALIANVLPCIEGQVWAGSAPGNTLVFAARCPSARGKSSTSRETTRSSTRTTSAPSRGARSPSCCGRRAGPRAGASRRRPPHRDLLVRRQVHDALLPLARRSFTLTRFPWR